MNTLKEKNEEISNLKSEKNKNSKEIIDLIEKNDILLKEKEELKTNNFLLEKKLEQKTKELEELNSATKKLIQNKENIILKYESELEMKNKEKILLISQNKELLNKLNDGNTDKEEKNNNENYLLNEEIKSLKEQLENQAHNLLRLTALENQINILQIEKYANSEIIKHSLTSTINNSSSKKVKKKLSITIVKDKEINNEIKNNTKTLDKTETAIKSNENEKINETEKNLVDENEKLKDEITKLKVKHLNMEFENESKLVKLKNIIKNIEKQCNKLGVKIDFNFNNII